MNISELYNRRQSCRNFSGKQVEKEKLERIMDLALLSPSACNAQPYFVTVAIGEKAKKLAKTTQGLGMNKFTDKATAMIVINEERASALARMGAKFRDNVYTPMDIGILTGHIVLAAEEEGLATCIIGWFNEDDVREICDIDKDKRVKLLIAVGYKSEDDKIREKKRKDKEEVLKFVE